MRDEARFALESAGVPALLARLAHVETEMLRRITAEAEAWQRILEAMGDDGNEDGGIADRACRLIGRQRARIAELEMELADSLSLDSIAALLAKNDNQSARIAELEAELINIADAEMKNFDDDTEFRYWTQSRARWTLRDNPSRTIIMKAPAGAGGGE